MLSSLSPWGASDATRLSHGAGEAVWLGSRHVVGSRASPEPWDSALLELVPSSQEGAFSFLTSLPVSTPRDLGSWSSSLSQVQPPLGQQWLTPHHTVPFLTLHGYSGHYPHKRCYVFLPRSTAGCLWYSRGREEHCLPWALLLSGGQSSTAAVLSQLLPCFLSLCLAQYMHRGQTALPTAPRFTLGQYFSEKQLFPLLVNAYLFWYLQVESTPKITVGKARKQHWGERVSHLLHVKVAFQSRIIGGR